MSNEIAVPTSDLAQQMEFVKLVTAGGRGSSILPDAYRDNPANALIAVGLGQAMGLSPAESLYRIAVIKGKPSAAAELIAANVRKAGHKLRVRVQEDPPMASCTIIRADDPDEPLTIERDMTWAQRMGLAGEPNYKKQPATMLSYRAITACARLACPEALYGVTYTPDEAASLPDESAAPQAKAADFTKAAPEQPEQPAEYPQVEDEPKGKPMTKRTQGQLFALFSQKGIAEDQQLAGINYRVGGTYESRGDVSEDDARTVIEHLKSLPDAEVADDADPGAPWPAGEEGA